MRNLILALTLVSGFALGVEEDKPDKSEGAGNCDTHTVINESSKVTHTITRCQGELVRGFPDKKPEPTNTEKNSKDEPNLHWELINSFDDLTAQERMASATESIEDWTLATAAISIMALILLCITVRQAGRMIGEAKTTSRYAFQSLKENRDERCAFLTFNNLINVAGNIATIGITNVGKTAATDMEASYCLPTQEPGEIIATHPENFSDPDRITAHERAMHNDHVVDVVVRMQPREISIGELLRRNLPRDRGDRGLGWVLLMSKTIVLRHAAIIPNRGLRVAAVKQQRS